MAGHNHNQVVFENFTFKDSLKKKAFILIGVGVIATIIGILMYKDHSTRIWSNFLLNSLYFLFIAVGGVFFITASTLANAGWFAAIKRIPEAMMSYLPVGAVFMLIFLGCSVMHLNHIYHWMDADLINPNSEKYDEIIAGKSGFLNVPFFMIRSILYLGIWILLAKVIRNLSIKEDAEGGLKYWNKTSIYAAIFIVFFAITSSTSAWDWIMSIDTHWFSTLFGWYTFSGLWVISLSTLTLIALYLKNNGYLNHVTENHLHDLGKFMFAFSIFWTYLWFSQFLLIWYANIPEETVYFKERFDNYKFLFFLNFGINFLFPFLVLMTRDSKRKMAVLAFVAIGLLVGHWIDIFLMIMPGTVGKDWGIGILEIGMTLGFAGLFIFVVMTALTKASLTPKHYPYMEESLHHQI